MDAKQYKTIDEYIANSPRETQDVLEKLRQTIKKAALKPRKPSVTGCRHSN